MGPKKDILLLAESNVNSVIYTCGSYSEYKLCFSYKELVKIINTSNNVCEYVSCKVPVTLFFDLESTTNSLEPYLDLIHDKIKTKFSQYTIQRILLSSHSTVSSKQSYHIIYRFAIDAKRVMFDNVMSLKNLCYELALDKFVDMAVYRDGLFRTYNSYKYNEVEKRYLIKDKRSDEFEFEESFITYGLQPFITINITDANKAVLLSTHKGVILNTSLELLLVIPFLEKIYRRKIINTTVQKFSRVEIYVFRLAGTMCPFLLREHKSNTQYIVYSNKSCYMKCFDELCSSKIYNKVTSCKYNNDLKKLYKEKLAFTVEQLKQAVQKVNLPTHVSASLTEMQISAIKSFIHDKYLILPSNITSITFQNNTIIVNTTITTCSFIEAIEEFHTQYIEISNLCSKLLCNVCSRKTDSGKHIVIYELYPTIIQNIIMDISSAELEATSIIKNTIDKGIEQAKYNPNSNTFNTKATSKCCITINNTSMEHVIDNNGITTHCDNGMKIQHNKQEMPSVDLVLRAHTKGSLNKLIIPDDFFNDNQLKLLYELLCYCCTERIIGQIFSHKKDNIIHLPADKYIYIYENNYWSIDIDDTQMCDYLYNKIFNVLALLKKRLLLDIQSIPDISEELLNKETNRIEKIIITILKSVGNRNILKNAIKTTYGRFNNNRQDLFDSKHSLVPFNNGVYDLYKYKFLPHDKNNYITGLINYNYNETVNNQNVLMFLNSILPNKAILDYVLKQCSNALDGNKNNNIFLIFTGLGGNGKTLFLNLLSKTFDTLGATLNSTIFTRKEADAQTASPALMKLKNKRFCSISETEANGEFNTSLLKKLTGDEIISCRELYKNQEEYRLRAKFFLACNQKPAVNAADEALWRRIRVIEFNQKFVETPIGNNEHLIDKTLMDKIDNDITWKQTMMNILLNYYAKSVIMPDEVTKYTNEYKDENNDFENWLNNNLIESNNKEDCIELKDILKQYLNNDKLLNSKISSNYKNKIINYIRKKYTKHDYEFKYIMKNGIKIRGWVGFNLITAP